MKKILKVLLVIILVALIGVVVWETPIVLKVNQKEKAIELLNKVYENDNYEVTKNYASDGVAYAEKEMTKKDYATVIEKYHNRECVSIDWFSNEYNNLAYYFDVEASKCYPEYTTERENTTVLPNESIINVLNSYSVNDLKFRDVEYEGIDALEIRIGEQEDVVVIDKATGFVLTEYNINGGVSATYTYKIGKVINNDVIPNFEDYTICIEMDPIEWQKSIVLNVTSDENLPEDFRNSFKDANKDLFDALEIKSTDDN